jgi:hypothetical protein
MGTCVLCRLQECKGGLCEADLEDCELEGCREKVFVSRWEEMILVRIYF